MNKFLYIDYENQDDCYNTHKVFIKKGFNLENYTEMLKVSDDNWKPNENDEEVLYFYPGCTVPRFKVKEHFKATIKPENATAAFIPDNGDFPYKSDKNMEIKRCVEMPVQTFLSYLQANYGKDKAWNKLHMLAHVNSISDCIVNTSFLVANYYHGPNNGTTGKKMGFDQWLSGSRWGYSGNTAEGCGTYAFIPIGSKLNNVTCPVFYESDILKHLNKDALVIDENKYNEMTAFGESEDDENIVLMMELMANCDFEKSYVYLLMLLKAYGNKMSYQPVMNHVNFRSLLKYFGLERKDIGSIDLLKLTNALKTSQKFTRANVQIIQSLCTHDYIRYDDKDVNKYYTEGPCLRPEFNSFN